MIEIRNYLRMHTTLTKEQELALDEIKLQSTLLSPKAVEQNWLQQILDLMYQAFEVDPKKFVKDIFFEFQLAKNRVQSHKERIYKELRQSALISGTLDEQMHLVNVYRNVVADLFDPYLSLLIASLQFREGRFNSFLQSNVGQGERNKVEYAMARLSGTTLFSGYNPVVRNAVSHAGTESILYEEASVVFRNIKRGDPPAVEVVKWSNEELYDHIIALFDFVHTGDVAVNIFGIDNYWAIEWDEELERDFIIHIISKEDRLELQKRFDELVDKIAASELSRKEKLEAISSLFFLELRKRDMPANSIRFNEAEKAALIEVPCPKISFDDSDVSIKRVLALLRYGIISQPCFKHFCTQFIVLETEEDDHDRIQIVSEGKELELYGKEEAGLVDLLADSRIYLNGQKIEIKVDFEKLANIEYSGFGKKYPRKNRG